MATDDNNGPSGPGNTVEDLKADIATITSLFESLSMSLEMLERRTDSQAVGAELYLLKSLVNQTAELFETFGELWVRRAGGQAL